MPQETMVKKVGGQYDPIRWKVYRQNVRIKTPWFRHYDKARSRCVYEYSQYKPKGILFKMTPEDFKKLWFRDKAYLMDKPTIDRKNSKGNYTIRNCQFIERSLNCSKGATEKWIEFRRKRKLENKQNKH